VYYGKHGEVNSKAESNSTKVLFTLNLINFLLPLFLVLLIYYHWFLTLKIYVIKLYIFGQTTITYESTPTKASNSDFAFKIPNECPVPALEGTNN
jgi:hypothetical protein